MRECILVVRPQPLRLRTPQGVEGRQEPPPTAHPRSPVRQAVAQTAAFRTRHSRSSADARVSRSVVSCVRSARRLASREDGWIHAASGQISSDWGRRQGWGEGGGSRRLADRRDRQIHSWDLQIHQPTKRGWGAYIIAVRCDVLERNAWGVTLPTHYFLPTALSVPGLGGQVAARGE